MPKQVRHIRLYSKNFMMNTYKRYNIIAGWLCFAISFVTYLSTIEPTVSWWDCGEFIAASHKLEVGHSPGAPLFLLLARLASLFAAPNQVAICINILSALCSAFTVLFLFWSITMLVKKIASNHLKNNENNLSAIIAIMGSGIVGSLAFAFSDSFWFSAVESEVYAMSSLFTALVFWAILKWDEVADEPGANRWLVLIAYLTGLSIGVHLLNLLAIPAITFIYYFRKYKFSYKGFAYTTVISIFILGFFYKGIISGFVKIASWFELFFANTIGLPFYSGLIIYLMVVTLIVIYFLWYSHKRNKRGMQLVALCFTYVIIGYSSYTMIIIRSCANTPLDEDNPENVFSLLSYLNREQYGSSPLLIGNYYGSTLDKNQSYCDGNPTYEMKNGRYEIIDDKKESQPNYGSDQQMAFPRMWSTEKNHVEGYKQWAGIRGDKKPSMGENLAYFFSYQLNFMYWRYFMWNFAGRQNDIQGHGDILTGNWLSGISFIDSMRLGDQSNLPVSIKENKAYNRFYLLPLILGLIGFLFHFKNDKTNAFVVLLLFFFTGIAIVIFLNQTPFQPRERDYAYVGSFYAFTIWIGIGTWALFSLMAKKVKPIIASVMVTGICLACVPVLMAKEGYYDHNRSGKYIARNFAYNLLTSCEPNAILFTQGDNDTFPLWYLQEVEGIRTDVRIICGALLRGDWYIQQMHTQINESDPLPFEISNKVYRQGYYPVRPLTDQNIDVNEIIRFVNSDSAETKLMTQSGKNISYLPAKNIAITENDSIKKAMLFTIKKNYLFTDDLFVLDLLAHNHWKRPIYFASAQLITSLINADDYIQQEGFVFHLTNKKNKNQGMGVNTKIMAENFLNKYDWTSFDTEDQYLDPESYRMCGTFRYYFGNLANALINEGDAANAEKVLDKCIVTFNYKNIPYDYSMIQIAQGYYRLGRIEKANVIIDGLNERYNAELVYYKKLPREKLKLIGNDLNIANAVLQQIAMLKKEFAKNNF